MYAVCAIHTEGLHSSARNALNKNIIAARASPQMTLSTATAMLN
jgi:hypothetical protein